MPDNNLNFVIEANIPFVKGLFEPYAKVQYLKADAITPEAVRNADAIVTRTRTQCDAALLDGSKVQLIATATIGSDHIDLPYCASRGIKVVNAPGCNAPAVAQYVFASAMECIFKPLGSHTIGIVGVGNVGRIVERWARALDMNVMLCDPLRQAAEGGQQWSSLDEIAAKADIITFHTPLTRSGQHPTYHMADEAFFSKLRRSPIIINSARGPVVDNKALLEARRAGKVGHIVMDCWENEPAIDPELLAMADVATPHIAGYSAQGKVRASQVAVDAICSHFGLPALKVDAPVPPAPAQTAALNDIMATYQPMEDTAALKAQPELFEHFRNTYNLRQEAPEGKAWH